MHPSNGGMANPLLEQQRFGAHGPSLQTSNNTSNSSCESGISKFSHTKSHATHHLSRWSLSNMQLFCKQAIIDWSTLSNMQLFWTNFAITSRPSLTGPPHNLQCAVAKSGNLSRSRLWSAHRLCLGFFVACASSFLSLVPRTCVQYAAYLCQ